LQELWVELLANFKPAYRVTIDVQRFESVQGETVVVEAVWAIGCMRGLTPQREPRASFRASDSTHLFGIACASWQIHRRSRK
jgi:hypothetical protein